MVAIMATLNARLYDSKERSCSDISQHNDHAANSTQIKSG